MRIEFVKSAHPVRHPDLICDAEITFENDGGPLSGLKLVGIGLWRSKKGVKVTMPSRAFRTGDERGYFDFLRSTDPHNWSAETRFKEWVAAKWREQRQGGGEACDRTRHGGGS